MPSEIGDIFFTNLMTATQLLARTEAAQDSGEYNRLHKLGYTDIEIRSLIRAGFNVSQLRAVANRINAAQRNGADSQGLTIEQLNDMLFKKRSINGVQTLGVIQALLSDIHSKMCEGDVARCIIEYVTMFDVPYGPGGTHGQIDVGTRHIIVEVKVGSITGRRDTYKQIKRYISNDMINSPDTNGVRKSVILYAPGYNKAASANITGIGGYITKSCEQLREQIRQLGGP